jgi:type VI secretion system protein ImpE
MEAQQLFRDGQLNQAIEACQQQLREHPDDATHRTFLFELQAFRGDWTRALRQLDFLEQHQAGSDWAAQVYRNLIEAEQRRERWAGQAQTAPDFLLDPPEHIRLHVASFQAWVQGDLPRAAGLERDAAELRPMVSGRLGGEPFQGGIQDCDDTLAPILELLILRDYAWVPWEQIRQLEVAPPERPRDLIWAPIRLELVDGSQRRGYVPTRYVASAAADDPQIQLGRLTDWVERPGEIVTGVGLKTLLVGERDVTILELTDLEIHADAIQ